MLPKLVTRTRDKAGAWGKCHILGMCHVLAPVLLHLGLRDLEISTYILYMYIWAYICIYIYIRVYTGSEW